MDGKQSFRVELFPVICLMSFLFGNFAVGISIADGSFGNHYIGYFAGLWGYCIG
jgi:hypothetical protein